MIMLESRGLATFMLLRARSADRQHARQRPLEEQVTLSSTARARHAAAHHPRFGADARAAHADPVRAEQLAAARAHATYVPVLDLTDWNAGTGPVRYAATGMPVDDAHEAQFAAEAGALHRQAVDLYETERARGTPAADVFDQLIALVDAQSADFRSAIDWAQTQCPHAITPRPMAGIPADPAAAARFARRLAYTEDRIALDVSEQGALCIAATGEPLTRAREAQFQRDAARVRWARIELYERARERDTSPADICALLAGFDLELRADYRALVRAGKPD